MKRKAKRLPLTLYIKVDLKRKFKKFQNYRKHAPFASLTLRDCGNRSESAAQILTLFEISCVEIAWQIGLLYSLSKRRILPLSACDLHKNRLAVYCI